MYFQKILNYTIFQGTSKVIQLKKWIYLRGGTYTNIYWKGGRNEEGGTRKIKGDLRPIMKPWIYGKFSKLKNLLDLAVGGHKLSKNARGQFCWCPEDG